MKISWRTVVVMAVCLCSVCWCAKFECPGSADCTCSRGVSGDYELLCPRSQLQPTLIAQVLPNKYVQLQCTVMKSWEELRLVSGLQIGPVNSFILRLCPLPSTSIRDLMTSVGVPSATMLQIQSHGNLGETLTYHHLQQLPELSQLNLSNNNLRRLPEDLFKDVGNITWLDLKNNIVQLPKGIFRYVPKLEVLELGSNNLTYLEPGVFRNLTKLRLLNLWSNRLSNLTRSVFSDVPNLENLDLNSNGLMTLPPDIFADLTQLSNLNLYGNDFLSLPQGLFLNTRWLEKFQLTFNRRTLRTLPSALLANLTHLKEVHLSSNNLTLLPENTFWGSEAITIIELQKNLLTELPKDIFKDNKEVTTLNLSFNKLKGLHESVFSSLEKLKVLDVSHNKITNIPMELFSSLRQLETLKMSDNLIMYIHPEAFSDVVKLSTLDLSFNSLVDLLRFNIQSEFGPNSIFLHNNKLETLYLSHNQLSRIYADWQYTMTSLRILDLSYNNFTNVTIDDLRFISSEITLDLSYNNISSIFLDKIQAIPEENMASNGNNVAQIVLDGNQLSCDCRAYDVVRFFKGQLEGWIYNVINLHADNTTCRGPQHEGVPVKKLHPRQLLCQVTEGCVPPCSCGYRPADSGLVVDCTSRGLHELPAFLPPSNTTLYMTNHTELFLQDNRITSLPGHLEASYSTVTTIDLSHNNLTTVNLTALSNHLEELHLDNNNLTRMTKESLNALKKFPRLKKVTLHKNPFLCDCQAKDLVDFLQDNYKKIPNLLNVTCSSGTIMKKLSISDLCPMTNIAIGIGSMLIAILGLLVGGTAAFYYRFQREIKVWMYAHNICLWFVTEEELDKDKVYDAFVSYSHQDENFVVEDLVPGLENGSTKYKLCLHYRDWLVGEMIPAQIARSVEESRRTVVILSPSFVESVWGRMEFRTAHSQALSEGRARVIVVLYGDLGPTDQLDPELRAYLAMNTYVKWGDPWFWEKLRYALPHPASAKGIPLQKQPTDRLISNGTVPPNSSPPPLPNTPSKDSYIIMDEKKEMDNSKPV